MTARSILLVLVILLALAVGGGALVRCEGGAPELTGPDEAFVGRNGASWQLRARDGESGLREVRVVLTHARGESTLAEHAGPGELLMGGDPSQELEIEVSVDPEKLGLVEGSAFLRARAWDWSWSGRLRGNVTEIEIPVMVDLTPPRLWVESGLTYVRRGGTAAVVYQAGEATARDGVEVGDAFFAGAPLPVAAGADPGRRLALFAVRRDAPPEVRIQVVASDRAGNRSAVPFAARIREREFAQVPLKISQSFLQGRVLALARELGVDTSDPIAAFRAINEIQRGEDEARIREIVSESAPERLWEGRFLQLPNSRVTSRFAEERSYRVEDREVSRAIHYGYDLASVANAPVLAANRGRVLYVGNLGIYGQTILLDHGVGLSSLYGHLSSLDVTKGDVVEKGQTMGRSGDTGLAGGDHLHFAILVGGVYVDPLEWWDAKWVAEHVETRLAAPPNR